jgi:hypothetical protein
MPKTLLSRLENHENQKIEEFWKNTTEYPLHQVIYVLNSEEIQYAFETSMQYFIKQMCKQLLSIEQGGQTEEAEEDEALHFYCIRPFHIFRSRYEEFVFNKREEQEEEEEKIAIFPPLSKTEKLMYLYWLSFQPEYEEYLERKKLKRHEIEKELK